MVGCWLCAQLDVRVLRASEVMLKLDGIASSTERNKQDGMDQRGHVYGRGLGSRGVRRDIHVGG